MATAEEFERQGSWLFRWRSYLPLLLVGLVAVALRGYRWPFEDYRRYALWSELCFGISLIGLLIRCVTIGYAPYGTSGRNTRAQFADQLSTTGPYSLVRHPLYLGNFLMGLGISSAPFVWWLPVMYCLLFCLYYERIIFVEEAYLRRKFGSKFDVWAATTPAFIPALRQWRRPPLRFSLRKVLRQEHAGLIVAILGNAAIQFSEHLIIDRRVVYEAFWVTLLVTGTTAYFSLYAIKKGTTLLNVPGR
jgi:protein-S-isoprenylcysteine O-methyltransferase Ste14